MTTRHDISLPTSAIASRYDVVVVGARAAGASTAMLLARSGLSVLAVDRSGYGTDTTSTHSLARAGVLQLSRWGLLDRLRAAGTPVTRTVVFRYDDTPAVIDVSADGDVDGVRSRVAAQVDAPVIHQDPVTSSNIYAYWTGLADDVMENHYDAIGRAVGVIPTNDGEACVWVAVPPERFRAEARGDLSGAYHRIIAESPHLTELLRGSTCNGGYRGVPGTRGFLRKAFGAGWALVGDAGYFKDPVSAHGITDAFISSELLSDALTAIVIDGDDASVALGAYQRQRDDLAALLTPPIAALARLDLDPVGAWAAFRALSPALRAEYELMAARPVRTLVSV